MPCQVEQQVGGSIGQLTQEGCPLHRVKEGVMVLMASVQHGPGCYPTFRFLP